MAKISALTLVRNPDCDAGPLSLSELRRSIDEQVGELCSFAESSSNTFKDFELALLPRLFAVGRLLMALFLTARHLRFRVPDHWERHGRVLHPAPAQSRSLNTRL